MVPWSRVATGNRAWGGMNPPAPGRRDVVIRNRSSEPVFGLHVEFSFTHPRQARWRRLGNGIRREFFSNCRADFRNPCPHEIGEGPGQSDRPSPTTDQFSWHGQYQLFFHAGLLDPRTTSTGSSQ